MTSGIVCNDVSKFIASGPRLPIFDELGKGRPASQPRPYDATKLYTESITGEPPPWLRSAGIKLAAAYPRFLSHDRVKEAVERFEKRWAEIDKTPPPPSSSAAASASYRTWVRAEEQLARQFTLPSLRREGVVGIGLWLLQDDEQTIMGAAKINPLVVRYAGDRFRDNRSLVLKLLSINGNALAYVNERFKTDIMAVITAVNQDDAALDLVPVPIRTIVQVVRASDQWTPKYELKEWRAKRTSLIKNSSKYGAATIERILSIFYKNCIEDLKLHYKRAQIQKELLGVDADEQSVMEILGIPRSSVRPLKDLRDAITKGPEYTQFIDDLLQVIYVGPPPGELYSPSSNITDSELRAAEQVFIIKVRRNLLKHLKEGIRQDVVNQRGSGSDADISISNARLKKLFIRKAEESFETSDEAKRDLNSDIMAARAEYEIVLQQREERSPANLNRQAALELRSRGLSRLPLLDLLDFFPYKVKKAVVDGVKSIRKAPREANTGVSKQEGISKLIEAGLVVVSHRLRVLPQARNRREGRTMRDPRFDTTRPTASMLSDNGAEFVASGPEKPALQPNASGGEEDDEVLTCKECGMASGDTPGEWRTYGGFNFCPLGTHSSDCLISYHNRVDEADRIKEGYGDDPVELQPSTCLNAKGSNANLETSVKLEEAVSAVPHSMASNSAEKALAIFAEDLVGEDVEDLEDGIRGDRLLFDMSSLLGDLNIGDKTQVMEKGFKTSGTLVGSEYDLDELDDLYADSGSGMSFEEIGAWSDASVSELDNIPFDTQPQEMMRF